MKIRSSNPIESILIRDAKLNHKFLDEYVATVTQRGPHWEPVVTFHKKKLGQQTGCAVIGGRKFYIWEYEKYQVMVHNIKGACIEVYDDSFDTPSPKDYWGIWEDYKSRIA